MSELVSKIQELHNTVRAQLDPDELAATDIAFDALKLLATTLTNIDKSLAAIAANQPPVHVVTYPSMPPTLGS